MGSLFSIPSGLCSWRARLHFQDSKLLAGGAARAVASPGAASNAQRRLGPAQRPESRALARTAARRDSLTEALRILAVDDNEEFLEALRVFLPPGPWQLITHLSAETALASFERDAPHLALIDLCLPGINGIECARQIRNRRPETVILLVTGVPNVLEQYPELASNTYKLLRKPLTGQILRDAIAEALKAGQVPSVAPSEEQPLDRRRAFIREKKLKPREVIALDSLAAHKAYKEIAAEQNWSQSLTKKILGQAMKKLGVHRRDEASEIWKDQTR